MKPKNYRFDHDYLASATKDTYSIESIADACGVTLATARMWLRGARSPTVINVSKLASLIGDLPEGLITPECRFSVIPDGYVFNGEKVNRIRISKQLSYIQLARRIKRVTQAVNDTLSGKVKNPHLYNVLRLAEALDCDVADFYTHPTQLTLEN